MTFSNKKVEKKDHKFLFESDNLLHQYVQNKGKDFNVNIKVFFLFNLTFEKNIAVVSSLMID